MAVNSAISNSDYLSLTISLINAWYGRNLTLIASQLPIANWHKMTGESTHTEAFLDRLVHGVIKL